MPRYLGLPAALARRGLTVEVVPGWETRGSSSFNPVGSVSHWTAGSRTGDRGSLAICVNGKTGVPGPLCNTFLPRSNVVIVVAAGRANHAGVGGVGGLVGNSSVWGTEAENSGGGEWNPFQRWAFPRINAAYIDISARRDQIWDHQEWAPTRKIDIRDWPMSVMRQQVHALLAGEDDMPLTEAEMVRIADLAAAKVWAYEIPERYGRGPAPAHIWIGDIASVGTEGMIAARAADKATAPMPAQIAAVGHTADDVQAQLGTQAATIVATITAAIREATGGSIDHAIVEQAVRGAVSKLTISMPEPDAS